MIAALVLLSCLASLQVRCGMGNGCYTGLDASSSWKSTIYYLHSYEWVSSYIRRRNSQFFHREKHRERRPKRSAQGRVLRAVFTATQSIECEWSISRYGCHGVNYLTMPRPWQLFCRGDVFSTCHERLNPCLRAC